MRAGFELKPFCVEGKRSTTILRYRPLLHGTIMESENRGRTSLPTLSANTGVMLCLFPTVQKISYSFTADNLTGYQNCATLWNVRLLELTAR